MKKIIILVFSLVLAVSLKAQKFVEIHNAEAIDWISGVKYNQIPYGPTPILNTTRVLPGALFFNTTDSSVYVWTGTQWIVAGGSGGGGGSFQRDTVKVRDDLYVFIDSTGHQVLGHFHEDGLISGGIVTSAGGLNVDVTSALYWKNQNQWVSPAVTLTLAASDPSNPRRDLIFVDTLSKADKKTGIAAMSPILPQVNPSSQIALTDLFIPAGATSLNVITKFIYQEGVTPWDTSHSGTMTVGFRNTDNPHLGTHAVLVSKYTDSSAVIFTDSGTDTVTADMILKMFLYLNGALTNHFQVQLFNSGTAITLPLDINYLFAPLDSNVYQNVSVPLNNLTFIPGAGIVFNKLVIRMAGTDTSGAKGYYLDDIQLQKGITNGGDFSDKVDSVKTRKLNDSSYVVDYWTKGISYQKGDTIKIHVSGAVRTVTGNPSDLVDNSDPINPVVQAPTLTEVLNKNNTTADNAVFQSGTDATTISPGQIQLVRSTGSIPQAFIDPTGMGVSNGGSATGVQSGQFQIGHNTGLTVTIVRGVIASPINDTVYIPAANNKVLVASVNGNFADSTGAVTISTGGTAVDTIYRTPGKDSIQFTVGGRYHAIKDSTGSAGATPTLQQVITAGNTLTKADTINNFSTLQITKRVIFDSTTMGTDYTRIGVLVNENFSGGSTPSGWTVGSGLSVSYTGAKATVTGAGVIGAPANGFPFTAYTSGIQYNTKRMPYEKVNFQMSVVPTTKSAGAVVGVFKGVLGNTIYAQEGIAWDLSNGPNSGRVTITFGSSGAGGNAVPTFTTNIDSTSKMNFSANDSLILYYYKNGWSVTAGIINKTTGKITKTFFNQRWNGSGGLWNLCFLNGTYVLTNATVNVLDRKGGVWFLGDSQTGGYGVSQQSKRFPELLYQDNPKYVGVFGLPSLTTRYYDTSGIASEIINDVQPSNVIFDLGYNDESENIPAATYKVYADSAIFPLQRAGINVSVSGIVPRAAVTTDAWNDSLQSLAAGRGCDFYDVRTLMKTSTGVLNPAYAYDLHINDTANIIWANLIRAKSGDSLLLAAAADTFYQIKIHGLHNAVAQSVIPLIGYDRTNTLVSVPNTFPTPAGWLQNSHSVVKWSSNAQANSEIHVSDAMISDSASIVNSTQGYRGGFNQNSSAVGSISNIDISNFGTAGTGIGQAWVTYTGVNGGNVRIVSASNNFPKTTSFVSMSGNSNFLVNTNAVNSGDYNTFLNTQSGVSTSGVRNFIAGKQANVGSSGDYNVQIVAADDYTLSPPAGMRGTIIIGSGLMFNSDAPVSGDISIGNSLGTNRFWLGGRGNNQIIEIDFPASSSSAVTDNTGKTVPFKASRGTGLSESGKLPFDFSSPTTTGTTLQSTYTRTFQPERLGVTIGKATTLSRAADGILDVQANTTDNVAGLILPRITTTQETALSQGLLTITVTGGGSGYTNGNQALVFSGGGGSGATGYVTVAAGGVQAGTAVITNRGTGYTSAPSATVATGSGATFTITVGSTEGSIVSNTTTHQPNYYNGTNYVPLGGVSGYTHTIFTPTTGQTITLINNQYNIVNPAGALLALTVNLPSTPSNNDVVYIKTTQAITTVTYANGTVVDGIASPVAGGLVVLTYDSGTTSWY